VIFEAPDGLIVVDTGRHASHTQRILDFAKTKKKPVKAVINTHWHLDHIGGNATVRKAFPGVRVYSSPAIEDALKGFLANYRKQLTEMIDKSAANEEAVKGFRAELAIIDSGPALYPDQKVIESGPHTIAGRPLELRFESHAVTAGDVWVFDPKTKVAVAGDLITLPAPFLDTACAKRWRSSLAALEATDFTVVVPGHGPVLSRAEFETYRKGFDSLLACGVSDRPKKECIDGWLADAGTLIARGELGLATGLVDYYVDNHFRSDKAKIADLCGE
jgi:glyoxylase-like metal-dependent hydrolase (beta-lactamase superfamily II)